MTWLMDSIQKLMNLSLEDSINVKGHLRYQSCPHFLIKLISSEGSNPWSAQDWSLSPHQAQQISVQTLITNLRTLIFSVTLPHSLLNSIGKMRPVKIQTSINLKIILICFLCVVLILLVFKSNFTPFQENHPPPILKVEAHGSNPASTTAAEEEPKPSTNCPSLPLLPTCTKTPPSLAQALVHYATANVTPQQTFKEISVSLRVLEKKAPCNFLVFGLGHDSLMWTALNHGGRTIFLEEDNSWIEQIKQKLPSLESYHVVYDTKVLRNWTKSHI